MCDKTEAWQQGHSEREREDGRLLILVSVILIRFDTTDNSCILNCVTIACRVVIKYMLLRPCTYMQEGLIVLK